MLNISDYESQASLNDAFELIKGIFDKERESYEKTIKTLKNRISQLEDALLKANKENMKYQSKISDLKSKLSTISKTVSKLEDSENDFEIKKTIKENAKEQFINIKKENKSKIDAIKEKLIDREDSCNIKMPICIYDASLKYQYNDTVIYRQLDECNIIDDYFKDDKKQIKKYFNLQKELNNNNLEYDSILIERKPHYCHDYNKDISDNIDNESKDSSKISDDYENDIDDYIEKKKAYKMIRKMTCVCSYLYYKNLISKNDKKKEKSKIADMGYSRSRKI